VTDDQGAYRLEGVPPGTYTLYVSTIGYRLLKKDIRLEEGDSQEVHFYLGQEASTINETVRVTAPVFEEVEKSAPSQMALTNTEIRNLAGVLLDDPLRSVQTLPGVATGDDFNSFYSVRGGSFENNGIMVDGVLTHSLTHALQGTQDPSGSVMIMNGDLVESMVLYSGAFSAKYGDRTASFLDILTREGSRDRVHNRLAVSGSNAAYIAEGPLEAKRRGAWIASVRKSYADYLVRRIGPENDLGLGFGDVQGKVVYDLTARQQLGASFIWGRSKLSRNPADRGTTTIIDGFNNAGVANLSWTWMHGPKLFWESRLYGIRETFLNKNKDNEVLDRGRYAEAAVRSDLSGQLAADHRVEFGFLSRYIQSSVLDRRYNYSLRQFVDFDNARGSYWQHAAYIQDRWSIREGRVTAIFGTRVDAAGLTGQVLLHPRVSLEWRWGRSHKLDAGWGIFSQFPEIVPVLGRNGDPRLRAEIARHYIVGYERLLGDKSRFRIDLFDKEESNLRRSRDNMFRLVNGKVTAPDINFRYDNALRAHTQGFEILLQRRSANRLAGWISYAYENSRREDLLTGERYNSDFEQRHTINVYGSCRFSESWNLSIKTRLGSGFPYPGYFEKRGEDFYLTTVRNRERLPFYSRADLRLSRAFYFTRSKLSLYLEVLNLTNRENLRYEQIFSVNTVTRKVSMGRDSLLPILPTAGFVLEF
jgi:outer membrane receptor for ferrienterochelin and colicin